MRSPVVPAPLVNVEGRWCDACPVRGLCASMATARACPEWPVDRASVPFHAAFGYGLDRLAAVNGADLTDVVALEQRLPTIGAYVPQIRVRSAFKGKLSPRRAYGVRLDQVLRRRVRTAAETREFCGVPEEAALILFCFAEDSVLESLWDDTAAYTAVARGGWDAITAPSYSLWFDRPRSMHFHSLKRSFDGFGALQQLGATAVPRVAFVDQRDVERQAAWCNANPAVQMVSLDLMTCRLDRDWDENTSLLALFDQHTSHRLHFLINGTRAFRRIRALFELLGPDRLTVSDATAAPPPGAVVDFENLSADLLTPSHWQRRVRDQDAVVARARAGSVGPAPKIAGVGPCDAVRR